MKKINSFIGCEKLAENKSKSKKLSLPEMEYEIEHCTAPWKCKSACYGKQIGCLQKMFGGENEHC